MTAALKIPVSGGFGAEGDFVTHALEAANESLGHPLLAAFVEIISAQFVVFSATGHKQEASDEQAVCHRHGGLARTATHLDAPEVRLHVGAIGALRGPGRLNKGLFDPAITVARSSALAFPGAFVMSRTQTGPRRRMPVVALFQRIGAQ